MTIKEITISLCRFAPTFVLNLAAEPELLTELIIGGLEQAVRWWFTDANPLPPEVLKKQLLESVLRLIS